MPITRLQPHDLDRIMVIQKNAYALPQLHEDRDSFRSKMALFPQGALGYVVDGELAAYLFCHPWRVDSVVPLDAVFAGLPAAPDCLYLHDLAVHSDYRGIGIARKLIDAALMLGQEFHFTSFELVAVQGAETFWQSIGFQAVNRFDYTEGVPAVKMLLELEAVVPPNF